MSSVKGKELSKRIVQDVGGAFTLGLAYIGDKLGLFKALAEHGPCMGDALAKVTELTLEKQEQEN